MKHFMYNIHFIVMVIKRMAFDLKFNNFINLVYLTPPLNFDKMYTILYDI